MKKKVVLSGVQPSGQLTLGNYLGALKNFTAVQHSHDSLYCIVDLHAITVRQDPADLRENTYAIAAWYLACGLDPATCTLFVQSQVPQHSELAWILSTFTQLGELERMTQFKDKAQKHRHNINAGLLTYPVLMAADILIYNADEVPVGDDQKQHIELTRDVAQRFNGVYGDVFTIPTGVIPKVAARIKDLQNPEKKMSKSEAGAGAVMMIDDAATITKKLKRAVTDNEGSITFDEDAQPGVANLITIFATCRGITPQQAVAHFAGKQYGALKGETAEAVVEALAPIQERYHALMAERPKLDEILAQGAVKARKRAEKTLSAVKTAVGFI